MSRPAALPAADQLVELSAARAALASIPVELRATHPYAILEVMFDSAGVQERTRLLDATVPADVAQTLLRTIVPAAPDGVGESGRPWGVLLKAAAEGEETTFRVERMEYCACSLINRREFTRVLESAMQQVRIPTLAGTRQTLIIDVRSDSTGAIVEKRLHQLTGYAELDRLAVQIADRMRVAPPLRNRQPVEMWSRVPISLTFPAAAKPSL
ncbi:MAG: hypothetical protein H0X65_05990 [Gemmatimonadetes bacterium]|nr:hypothetical protein [Gemmatimonadota bacterium]